MVSGSNICDESGDRVSTLQLVRRGQPPGRRESPVKLLQAERHK